MNIYDIIIGGFFGLLVVIAIGRIISRKNGGCGCGCDTCPYDCKKNNKVHNKEP